MVSVASGEIFGRVQRNRKNTHTKINSINPTDFPIYFAGF
jgi:hypothetical protein